MFPQQLLGNFLPSPPESGAVAGWLAGWAESECPAAGNLLCSGTQLLLSVKENYEDVVVLLTLN
jgi:hypothetical protein